MLCMVDRVCVREHVAVTSDDNRCDDVIRCRRMTLSDVVTCFRIITGCLCSSIESTNETNGTQLKVETCKPAKCMGS